MIYNFTSIRVSGFNFVTLYIGRETRRKGVCGKEIQIAQGLKKELRHIN